MSTVLFLSCGDLENIEPAAKYLAAQGHTTRVVADAMVARKLLSEAPPDILVSHLFIPSSDGAHEDIFRLAALLQQRHPANQTRVVVLTNTAPNGEPSRFWPDVADSYVLGTADAWQVILAVEQFFHRDVRRR
jgi:CheY-like chemotaxis protein